MTTVTLQNTYVAAGYYLAKGVTGLDIASTAKVGGKGVGAGVYATIVSYGLISAASEQFGIELNAGGDIVNEKGARINGGSYQSAVYIHGGNGRLLNLGAILSNGVSVVLNDTSAGGTVTNGSAADAASIVGSDGGVEILCDNATFANYGTVKASAGFGVQIDIVGRVTNGSLSDTSASISGQTNGVVSGSASTTVDNFAQITGVADYGVELLEGGAVTNGGSTDKLALISGAKSGVYTGAAATITNFATISATGKTGNGVYARHGTATISNFGTLESASHDGVVLDMGGLVNNGSSGSTSALIEGGSQAIYAAGAAATLMNYAVVTGHAAGVDFEAGGNVINGSPLDLGATIKALSAVVINGGAGTVINFGVIDGQGSFRLDAGAYLSDGGMVFNGAKGHTGAGITGASGVIGLGAAITITNQATITGAGAAGSAGVEVTAGGTVINGNTAAVISGYDGVDFVGAGTVTNYGTIAGLDGVAVRLTAATEMLVVEAASVFQGQVLGGGGALRLANGTGTLTGLFSAAGVKVTGSMAATTFQAFDTVQINAGAKFTDADATTTIAAADRLSVDGNLTLSGAIANAGTIVAASANGFRIAGALTNNGRLIAASGTLALAGVVTGTGEGQVNAGLLKAAAASTFNQNVLFAGSSTGTLELAHGQTYAGTISGFSLTGATTLDLDDIGFTAGTTTATYAGTASSGVLTVTDGTHTANIHLAGNYTASTWTLSSDGHGGTDIVDPTPASSRPPAFVQAIAGMANGGGSIGRVREARRHDPVLLSTPRFQTA